MKLPELKKNILLYFLPVFLIFSSAKSQTLDSLTIRKLEKHFTSSFVTNKEDKAEYSTVVYGLIHFSPTGNIDSFFVSNGSRYGLLLQDAIRKIPGVISLQFNEPAVMLVNILYLKEENEFFKFDSLNSINMDPSFLKKIAASKGKLFYLVGPLQITSYQAVW